MARGARYRELSDEHRFPKEDFLQILKEKIAKRVIFFFKMRWNNVERVGHFEGLEQGEKNKMNKVLKNHINFVNNGFFSCFLYASVV